MSGNSADSFSEESEPEEEKEEVKEKPEVVVKKKGPGRPPRKKKAPNPSPVTPSVPNAHKRRCVPPKSGICHPMAACDFLISVFSCLTVLSKPENLCHREAWCVETTLVGGGACSCRDSPEEKPHGTAGPCKSRL